MLDKTKKAQKADSDTGTGITMGRRRNPKLDGALLTATLEILAEKGFDSMTMDMVAAHAKSGKASLYRRWASKPELVRDALIFMSGSSVETSELPETGTLKSDLLTLLKPFNSEHNARKVKVLSKLGSFQSAHKNFFDEALQGIFQPWVNMNRRIFQRALERGQISAKADIELACELISAMTAYKTQIQRSGFTRAFYEQLLDNMILPALKNSES